jgi:hypothetical protein
MFVLCLCWLFYTWSRTSTERTLEYVIPLYSRSSLTQSECQNRRDGRGPRSRWRPMNIVLSVFFVPYILLEVPSNILLKRFKRPSYYLGILIVCWGIVMTMMGVVKDFAGLLATHNPSWYFRVSSQLATVLKLTNRLKGWILPGRRLSLHCLVPAKRPSHHDLVLLLRISPFGCLLRSPLRRHCRDGWSRRIRGMAVDLFA